MAKIERKQGDTITVSETFERPGSRSSQALDLSDAQSVKIYVDHPSSGDLVVNDTAEITDAANGMVEYTLGGTQTARQGQHRLEFVAEFAGGETFSYPQTGFVSLKVTDSAARELPIEEVADGDVNLSGTLAAGDVNLSGTLTGLLLGDAADVAGNPLQNVDRVTASGTAISVDSPVAGQSPQTETHLTTKGYVDSVVQGLGGQEPDNTVAHYDASQLSLNDGDTVSVWPDEQGDNDLDTQTGSPTYVESGINGNPAIAFDGDALEVTGLSVTQPNTTYLVFEYHGGFDGGRVLSGVSGRQLTAWAERTEDVNWRTFAGGDLNASTDLGIQQMTAVFDGADSSIRENGVETSVGDAGTNDLGGLSVGYDSYGYENGEGRHYVDAYVSEIVVVNSGSVNLGFENHLLEKWGITA
jgi:hypothetical protein